MAISYRSTGVSPGADSTSCVVVKPASLAVGDLMIAHVVGTGATIGSFTAPDGTWNSIRQETFVGTIDVGSALWWKIATQTDVDATNFTFTATGAASNCGAIAAFYGHNAVSPINTSNGQQNAASTTITSPAITPSVADCVICLFGAMNDNNVLSNWRISVSNPATWNLSHNIAKNLADDLVVAMRYAVRPETTSTGEGLIDSNGSDGNVGQMVAIAPYVAPQNYQRDQDKPLLGLMPSRVKYFSLAPTSFLLGLYPVGLKGWGKGVSSVLGETSSIYFLINKLITPVLGISAIINKKLQLRYLISLLGLSSFKHKVNFKDISAILGLSSIKIFVINKIVVVLQGLTSFIKKSTSNWFLPSLGLISARVRQTVKLVTTSLSLISIRRIALNKVTKALLGITLLNNKAISIKIGIFEGLSPLRIKLTSKKIIALLGEASYVFKGIRTAVSTLLGNISDWSYAKNAGGNNYEEIFPLGLGISSIVVYPKLFIVLVLKGLKSIGNRRVDYRRTPTQED